MASLFIAIAPYLILFVIVVTLIILFIVFRCKIPGIKFLFLCGAEDGEACNLPTDCKSNLKGGNGNCCNNVCTNVKDMDKDDANVYWCPGDMAKAEIITTGIVGGLTGNPQAGVNQLLQHIDAGRAANTELCKQQFGNHTFGKFASDGCFECGPGWENKEGSPACSRIINLVGSNDVASRPWTYQHGNSIYDNKVYRCPFHYRKTLDDVGSDKACAVYQVGDCPRCDSLQIGTPGPVRVGPSKACDGSRKSCLRPTQELYVNQNLTSPNGLYQLQVRSNGIFLKNLGNRPNNTLWHLNVNNPILAFQGDNNFVVYSGGGPQWAANTMRKTGGVSRLAVQNDGNVVVYGNDNSVLWSAPNLPQTWSGTDLGKVWKCPDGYGRTDAHIQSNVACGNGDARAYAQIIRDNEGGASWSKIFGKDTGLTNPTGSTLSHAKLVGPYHDIGNEVGKWQAEGYKRSRELLHMGY